MQYQSFLIKYAEIGTKGKNRYMFEDALIKQIRYALKSVEGQFDVTKESGRIYVKAETDYDYDDAVEALKRVFGIADICPMVQIEDKDYENLKQHVVEYMDQVYPDKNITFKVNARRGDKQYPVTSEQINRDMGEVILEAFPQMRVDVHHPDVILHVEVRQRINLFSLMIPGPGGMPVGTNGRAMLLLSGGIDSPVAGYMIAKRGVKIDAVYFHAPPYTSERAKQKVVDLANLVARYAGPINLHVVNFTDIQLYIYDKCPHEELTIIMRRYMMRIALSRSAPVPSASLQARASDRWPPRPYSPWPPPMRCAPCLCSGLSLDLTNRKSWMCLRKSAPTRHPYSLTRTAAPFLWPSIR